MPVDSHQNTSEYSAGIQSREAFMLSEGCSTAREGDSLRVHRSSSTMFILLSFPILKRTVINLRPVLFSNKPKQKSPTHVGLNCEHQLTTPIHE